MGSVKINQSVLFLGVTFSGSGLRLVPSPPPPPPLIYPSSPFWCTVLEYAAVWAENRITNCLSF